MSNKIFGPSADLTLADVRRALSDEALAKELGKHLAETLQLKRKGNGRYDLVGGDKTDIGLSRTIVNMLAEYPIKQDLRKLILEATPKTPVDPVSVIKSLMARGYAENEIKTHMWDLLGQNLLSLDNAYLVYRTPESELVPA